VSNKETIIKTTIFTNGDDITHRDGLGGRLSRRAPIREEGLPWAG